MRQIVAGGFYMQVLAGTPEQIVDRMLHLSHAGIDDLNMTFVDNQNELHAIIHHVLPLQEQARLRRRFAAREVAQKAGL